MRPRLWAGFNPCSGGSIALGSAAVDGFAPTAYRFQSLFWWKYCPGANNSGPGYLVSAMFQSLFWWKYCPGPGKRTGTTHNAYCFNPCSGGSIALGVNVHDIFYVENGFQSLFWWKYCPGPSGSHYGQGRRVMCFNPCSGGSIALGQPEPLRPTSSPEFQSLFWWKYCPGPSGSHYGQGSG